MTNPSFNTAQVTPMFKGFHLPLLLALSLLVSACDGGLFGTGDGPDTVDIVTAPAADPPNSGAGGDGGSETPDASPSAPGAAGDDQSPTLSFENLIPSGLDTPMPLLKLINQSSKPIKVHVNAVDVTDNTAITPTNNNPIVALSLMDNTVLIEDTAMNTLGTISPLTAASSTLTTIITRDLIAGVQPANTSGFLIASTRANSGAPGLSLVRVIQVSPLASTIQSADFTLFPDTINPGSSELLFNQIDALNNPVSEYQLANAGQYVLNDSLNRFSPVAISIAADKVYTLLITDIASSSLQVEIDSDITLP